MINTGVESRDAQKKLTSKLNLEQLTLEILERASGAVRFVIAIVGPPGSGKSTATAALKAQLLQNKNVAVQVVPMDGFHYDNAILEQLGLTQTKGSPETFDIGGLESILQRLIKTNPTQQVAVPVFDRDRDLSLASARIIDKSTNVLLIEGNYLLLQAEPWSHLEKYFDLSVMIQCNEEILRARLMQRWQGLNYDGKTATMKVEISDIPNANLVIRQSRSADVNLMWN